ncbi:hypothetical protein EV714DRAFT_254975 [Schizophyllum commune]
MADTNAPREKLAQSLSQLSHYLRSVAKDADAYALALANGKPINGAIDSSDDDVPQPKGRKRKSPDDDDGKRKKRAKKEKDPNAPKRPATSYILYQNDCRQSMKEKNPGLNNTELLRYISETWKSLPEQEKSSYEAKAAKLKHDYEDAAREYGGANGKPVEPSKGVKKPTPVAKPASVAKPVDSDEEESGSEEEARAPKPVAPKSSATKPTAPKVSAKPASKAKAKPAAVVEDSEEEDESSDDEPPAKKAPASKKQAQRQEESSGDEDSEEDEIEQPPPPSKRGKKGK